MFIFYKMEYVIAYKMLFKESIDEEKKTKTFFWECHWSYVGACHLILLLFWIYMSSLFGFDDTASLCLRCFCNANVKYTSTFQCCYDQRLLFLSLLSKHRIRRHKNVKIFKLFRSHIALRFPAKICLACQWTCLYLVYIIVLVNCFLFFNLQFFFLIIFTITYQKVLNVFSFKFSFFNYKN